MKNPKALFLCNEKFLDATINTGGVKLCTDEFKALLKTAFTLEDFSVSYAYNLLYRLKSKLGVGAYEDYNISHFKASLEDKIRKEQIQYVFLNLSNTASFSKVLKSMDPKVKVILCSHGNESGDFLHETVMHQKYRGFKRNAAYYNLGKMLASESKFRQCIDLVLTVSNVEEEVEKWLGAKNIYMVPRVIDKQCLEENTVIGRIGFVSDLSHEPNFYGINELCKAIVASGKTAPEIRLVGGGDNRGNQLAQRYNFVNQLGYLKEEEMKKELSTWTFALNPVFYYSRGVSTKLGKCLGLGIPVITTAIGMRGYCWQEGELPISKSKNEMADQCIKLSRDETAILYYREEVKRIQTSTPKHMKMMEDILDLLHH